jgi:hypothetical protein
MTVSHHHYVNVIHHNGRDRRSPLPPAPGDGFGRVRHLSSISYLCLSSPSLSLSLSLSLSRALAVPTQHLLLGWTDSFQNT